MPSVCDCDIVFVVFGRVGIGVGKLGSIEFVGVGTYYLCSDDGIDVLF